MCQGAPSYQKFNIIAYSIYCPRRVCSNMYEILVFELIFYWKGIPETCRSKLRLDQTCNRQLIINHLHIYKIHCILQNIWVAYCPWHLAEMIEMWHTISEWIVSGWWDHHNRPLLLLILIVFISHCFRFVLSKWVIVLQVQQYWSLWMQQVEAMSFIVYAMGIYHSCRSLLSLEFIDSDAMITCNKEELSVHTLSCARSLRTLRGAV